jgi:hypothetical protein
MMLSKRVQQDASPVPTVSSAQFAEQGCQTIVENRNAEQQTFSVRTESKSTLARQEMNDAIIATDIIPTETVKEEPSPPTEPLEGPIYLIVQKEQEKYKGLVQRTSEEKKRRYQEVNHLKQELDAIKSVLRMAGLQFDYKECIEAHTRAKAPITIANNCDLGSKQSLLPPIQKRDDILKKEDLKDATIQYLENDRQFDFSDLISELTDLPPKDSNLHYTRNRKMRPYSADQIPAILAHNQNLDYNNRVHFHLDNVVYHTELPTVTETTQLPPVIEKKILQKSHRVGSEKTSYANRVWRANTIKKLQGLRDKAL